MPYSLLRRDLQHTIRLFCSLLLKLKHIGVSVSEVQHHEAGIIKTRSKRLCFAILPRNEQQCRFLDRLLIHDRKVLAVNVQLAKEPIALVRRLVDEW